MEQITYTEAVAFVRKNLDETPSNASSMLADADNTALDTVIKKTLPEAINDIVSVAPANTLEAVVTRNTSALGETVDPTDHYGKFEVKDSSDDPYKVLRVVKCLANDVDAPEYNGYVVTDAVPEFSPEGRKQFNKYTRGTYDNPVLVLKQGTYNSFVYWSHIDDTKRITNFDFIPEYELEAGDAYHEATSSSNPAYYDVPSALKTNILNRLTGLVMTILGMADSAAFYLSKAEVK